MRALLPVLLLAAAAALAADRATGRPHRDAAWRLFRARCSTCHDPSRVNHRQAGRDEWREIVHRMQRMPGSGITNREAEIILDYLVALGRGGATHRAVSTLGGRRAYGRKWLSILETAVVAEGRVRLGGRTDKVKVEGLRVTLGAGPRARVVELSAEGLPIRTALIDAWKVGRFRYEVHLVFYELRDGKVRLARALRRTP